MDVKEVIDSEGSVRFIVKSDKFKATFEVKKSNNGYAQFEIGVSKGTPPKALQGVYTKADYALEALKRHINNSKNSLAVSRDKRYDKKNATAVPTESI